MCASLWRLLVYSIICLNSSVLIFRTFIICPHTVKLALYPSEESIAPDSKWCSLISHLSLVSDFVTKDQCDPLGLSPGVCVSVCVCVCDGVCVRVCVRKYSTRHQFISITQLCPILCDPMDYSMPGFPLHHQLLALAQTHVHWFSDAIQPSHPLSSPSPPAFNLSQHQGLFQWISSSYHVVKVSEFQLQHQSFRWIFRTDFL